MPPQDPLSPGCALVSTDALDKQGIPDSKDSVQLLHGDAGILATWRVVGISVSVVEREPLPQTPHFAL